MKLKEINPSVFQHNKDINYDVSKLYESYADKEIYELLKENMNQNILFDKIDVKPTANYWTGNNFKYVKGKEINENHEHFYYTLLNSLTESEKQTLLQEELDKSPEKRRFAEILVKNEQVKLTQEQFDMIFNEKHPYAHSLKGAMIDNKNIPFTESQINEGLLNWDSGLSINYAKRGDTRITHETIEALIHESNEASYHNEDVLVELLKHKNLKFTPEQIEFFLTNDNFMLRAECARNYQLSFTKNQIKRGLEDEGFEYEAYDDTYADYNPSDVVNAFMNNPKIKLSKEATNNIVYGYNEYANIESFVQKENLQLEKEHVNRILDKNDRSSVLLLQNKNVHLDDHQLIKTLYKSEHWPKYVAEYYLSRDDVTVSEVVLSVLKISPSPEIQKVLEERGNSILNSVENNNSTIKKKKM